MNLYQATVECAFCPRKFHQIDGTRVRALSIAQAALAEHVADEHEEQVA